MSAKKQVILIMTDSQRWDMVGCYRNTGLKTPCIDRMAAQGVRFERAYTAQPVCQPARAAIFTGLYPHSCESWSNSMGISQTAHTIGERAKDNGIRAAYIGKWHLDGGDYFGQGRCPAGWDAEYWYDMRNYLDELTPEERVISRDANNIDRMDIDVSFTFGHRCADRAVRFIEENREQDSLLCVSFDEPHDPCLCPRKYADMYRDFGFPKSENVFDTLEGKPDHQKVWAGSKVNEDKQALSMRAPYFFGCNTYIDSEIGRVLDAAEKYMPDALVIYTSDHGDMLNSHSLWAKGPAVYDEITRIPFIVKGAGVPAGRVSRAPISHINIAPTVLNALGIDAPDILEGKSIAPQIYDPDERVNPYVFIEFGRYEVDHDGFGGFQPMRAVFDGRYKLCVNLLSTDELYDLESDPGEMINRIDDNGYASVRDKLHDALISHMDQTRDPFRGYQWVRRPWRANAAPATWDNSGMTRQRHEEERYEPYQLDYRTGMPVKAFTRVK